MSVYGVCTECGRAKVGRCRTHGCPNNEAESAAMDIVQAINDIPILGEIGPDGKVTWYGDPPAKLPADGRFKIQEKA